MDSVIFALIFSEFGYVPDFFYVPNFLFEPNSDKSSQKWLSPNFFLSVFKNTCDFYYIKIWKHLEKSWDSVVFALIFQKNIEKVWDIEKFCNIAKFRKNQGKNDRVPSFFYVQVFRWTGLLTNIAYMFWNKTICKHIQARGMLRCYNKKNTDKAKSCLRLKLRNFTIESIQTKAKLCSKYMCQFEAYKSRMLSTSNQGSSDLTRQIVGRPVWKLLEFSHLLLAGN